MVVVGAYFTATGVGLDRTGLEFYDCRLSVMVKFNAPENVRMLAYVAALSVAQDRPIESVKVYTVNNGRSWRVALNGRWIASVMV